MKISSHQFVKAALIGLGLFAVLLAWRADKAKESRSAFSPNNPNVQLDQAEPDSSAARQTLTGDQALSLQLPKASDSQAVLDAYPQTGCSVDFAKAAPEQADDLPMEVTGLAKMDVNQEATPLSLESPEIDNLPGFSSESTIDTEFDFPEAATPVDFVEQVPARQSPERIQQPTLSEAAAQKAVHHIEYGKSLARRNAREAASQEFLGALRVLAESNDASTGHNMYSESLRRGLMAIKEAEDFKYDDPNRQISLNVASVVETHQTDVISPSDAEMMTASAAMRRYLEFAGEMLGTCGGQNAVAAEALYCLGKMRTIETQSRPDPESLVLYEAIIFHHASLIADPRNYRSANELGVLLAKTGQLDAAEIHLKNSLSLRPVPQAWANLAKVHQRKGSAVDQQLATLAMNEYQMAMARQSPVVSSPIQWVQPAEFTARSPLQTPDAPTVYSSNSVVPVNSESEDGKPSFVERIGSLIPFSRR